MELFFVCFFGGAGVGFVCLPGAAPRAVRSSGFQPAIPMFLQYLHKQSFYLIKNSAAYVNTGRLCGEEDFAATGGSRHGGTQ